MPSALLHIRPNHRSAASIRGHVHKRQVLLRYLRCGGLALRAEDVPDLHRAFAFDLDAPARRAAQHPPQWIEEIVAQGEFSSDVIVRFDQQHYLCMIRPDLAVWRRLPSGIITPT